MINSQTLIQVNVFPGTCPKTYLFQLTYQDRLSIEDPAALGISRDHECERSLQPNT